MLCNFPPIVLNSAYPDVSMEIVNYFHDIKIAEEKGLFLAVGDYILKFRPQRTDFTYMDLGKFRPEVEVAGETKTFTIPPIDIPFSVDEDCYIDVGGVYIFNPLEIVDGMANTIGMPKDTWALLKMKVYEFLYYESIFNER